MSELDNITGNHFVLLHLEPRLISIVSYHTTILLLLCKTYLFENYDKKFYQVVITFKFLLSFIILSIYSVTPDEKIEVSSILSTIEAARDKKN